MPADLVSHVMRPKRDEGVDMDTFLRLVKFHELNVCLTAGQRFPALTSYPDYTYNVSLYLHHCDRHPRG